MRSSVSILLACAAFGFASTVAVAQIKVGVIVSATGPAASIGGPEQRVAEFMPTKIGERSVEYIILDDATDTNQAVKAARKLTADSNVDVIIGPSVSAPAIAVVDVVAEFGTPLISMASSSRITSPVDDKRKWAFKVVMDESLMMQATLDYLKKQGIKNLAFIGASDAYGDAWLNELNKQKGDFGIELVALERFASTDVSVLAQVAKTLQRSPDAVLIAAAGTPAALPHKTLKERGYRGLIIQTFGSVAPEVLKIGGKDMEATVTASNVGFVTEQMEENDPVRLAAEDINRRYAEASAGGWSPFAHNAWSAWQLLEDAVSRVPLNVEPGTAAFRSALRDQIEATTDLTTAIGIISMTPTDHMGFDLRSTSMFELKEGAWHRIKK